LGVRHHQTSFRRMHRAATHICGVYALALVSAVGCAGSSDTPVKDTASTLPVPPSHSSAEAAPTAADTAGCELSREVIHPSPDSLLREFVRRDAAGQFTRSTDWFNQAVDCPGHEPGPDGATPVLGYHIRELARTDGSVRSEVLWDRPRVEGSPASQPLAETLTVVRTLFGWRMRSPALNPKVPARAPRRS
jgi:hypothetical protein